MRWSAASGGSKAKLPGGNQEYSYPISSPTFGSSWPRMKFLSSTDMRRASSYRCATVASHLQVPSLLSGNISLFWIGRENARAIRCRHASGCLCTNSGFRQTTLASRCGNAEKDRAFTVRICSAFSNIFRVIGCLSALRAFPQQGCQVQPRCFSRCRAPIRPCCSRGYSRAKICVCHGLRMNAENPSACMGGRHCHGFG